MGGAYAMVQQTGMNVDQSYKCQSFYFCTIRIRLFKSVNLDEKWYVYNT